MQHISLGKKNNLFGHVLREFFLLLHPLSIPHVARRGGHRRNIMGALHAIRYSPSSSHRSPRTKNRKGFFLPITMQPVSTPISGPQRKQARGVMELCTTEEEMWENEGGVTKVFNTKKVGVLQHGGRGGDFV